MEGHKTQKTEIPYLYGNDDFRNSISEAKLDFKDFFQAEEAYRRVIDQVESTVFAYTQQTAVYGREKSKLIVEAALSFLYNAINIDKNKTLSIIVKIAEDSDAALSLYWSINKRSNKLIHDIPNKSLLTRDKAFELLDILRGLIEGIYKKEVWFLLAFKDVIENSSSELDRWRQENLGNIVKAISKLPTPLGDFLVETSLTGVSLNQLRNIAAHNDFVTKKDIITLSASRNPKDVSLDELVNSLVEIGLRRIFLRICINIIMAQYRHEIQEIVYQHVITPETLSVDLSAILATQNITLEHISRVGNDTEIQCESRGYPEEDPEPVTIIQSYLHEVLHVYDDVFPFSDNDKIRVILSNEYADEFLFSIERRYANVLFNKKSKPKKVSENLKD